MEGWMGWNGIDCWKWKIIKGIVHLEMWVVYCGTCLVMLVVLLWMVVLSCCCACR